MPKSPKENNKVFNDSRAHPDRPSKRSIVEGLRELEASKRKSREKKRHRRS